MSGLGLSSFIAQIVEYIGAVEGGDGVCGSGADHFILVHIAQIGESLYVEAVSFSAEQRVVVGCRTAVIMAVVQVVWLGLFAVFADAFEVVSVEATPVPCNIGARIGANRTVEGQWFIACVLVNKHV